MNIKELLKGIDKYEIKGKFDVEILGLSQKADECETGYLFFCYRGVNNDGHNFVNVAVKNGAVCIMCERFLENCNCLQIKVRDVRSLMFKVCNKFYNNIIKKFKFIGVTGTNGKTTCTTLIQSIINNAGKKTCLIGTNGTQMGTLNFPNKLTTPDTLELFKILEKAKEEKCEYIVMEISAHAIELKKIKGLKFEVGVFTNLTQDHLDYFKTMYKYALTKLKFLQKQYCKSVVINIDDKYGQLFYKLTKSNVYTYALDNPANNFAMQINLTSSGSNFLVNVLNSVAEIKTDLICRFNVYNILASCVAAKILGFDMDCIVNGIKDVKSIKGRLNIYKLKNGSTAIIDYAHTPDGLEKVLENLKSLNFKGKIITVFGCGGNRDKTKRYKMGQIVDVLSDEIILTNDNPRFENEQKIIEDILQGIKREVLVDTNRERAIEKAICISRTNDVILIAGKGCEQYQEQNGIRKLFSDEEVIKKFC